MFTAKSKINIFPPTCSAVYLARLFWSEFQSFADNSRRDVCLCMNIISRHHFTRNDQMSEKSLYRNDEPVAQDKPVDHFLWKLFRIK